MENASNKTKKLKDVLKPTPLSRMLKLAILILQHLMAPSSHPVPIVFSERL